MIGNLRLARDADGNPRPGVWELRVNIGRDPGTGKRKQLSRAYKGTKRDAQKELARLVSEVEAGRHKGTDVTFGALLERYLEQIGDERSPSTMKGYRWRAARLTKALGAIPLRKLSAYDLDRFYKALTADGHSPADVRQYHAIARGALAQAHKWDWVTTNVAKQASPPAARHHEVKPPAFAVVAELMEVAAKGTGHPNSLGNPDLAVFIRLAASTGARRGELCALRWSDLSPDGQVVRIARNLVDGLGRDVPMVEKDTKTHSVREVMLDDDTRQVLAEHLRAVHERATMAGVLLHPQAHLFSFDVDCARPWRPEYVTLAFRRLCEHVGVKVRLHDLRHLSATTLLDAGVPLHTVSRRLGHRDATTTMNTYGHAVDEREQEAADVVGRALGRVTAPVGERPCPAPTG